MCLANFAGFISFLAFVISLAFFGHSFCIILSVCLSYFGLFVMLANLAPCVPFSQSAEASALASILNSNYLCNTSAQGPILHSSGLSGLSY